MTGIGRQPNGWPSQTKKWWDDQLEGQSHEIKKLRHGQQMHQVFHGIAVDGSTAYAPDQESEEEEYGNPIDVDSSPVTSGSRKWGSNTNTTGASPAKKTKSSIVKILGSLLQQNNNAVAAKLEFMERQAAKQAEFIERQAAAKAEIQRKREEQKALQKQEEMSELHQMRQIALEDGLKAGSSEYMAIGLFSEYMAIGLLWEDFAMKELWWGLQDS